MTYDFVGIADGEIPKAADPLFQHLVDTYGSETNKVISTWRVFLDGDLPYRPHPKSASVLEIFHHQQLSERRFFFEFLDFPEPAAAKILPADATVSAFSLRMRELAAARLGFLSTRTQPWWLEAVPFFDQQRQRIWIFWRRILHTSHHRTQLTGYLRLLDRPVPSTYGPTADVTWAGADPTHTLETGRGIKPPNA